MAINSTIVEWWMYISKRRLEAKGVAKEVSRQESFSSLIAPA